MCSKIFSIIGHTARRLMTGVDIIGCVQQIYDIVSNLGHPDADPTSHYKCILILAYTLARDVDIDAVWQQLKHLVD